MVGLSKVEAQKRHREVLDLRVNGMTPAQIAEKLELSYVTVLKYLNRAEVGFDPALLLQAETNVDMHRLDALFEIYFPRAKGDPDSQTPPDLDAAHFCLKVLERRAKMLGIDAPKRIDIRAIVEQWARAKGLDPVVTATVVGELVPGVG